MTPRLFDVHTGDIAALARLHALCFPQAWTAPAIAGLLASSNCFAFSCADGFVLARAAGGEAEILTLAVAPPAQGRGLGRALVEAAAAHAQKQGAAAMFLEVAIGNGPALAVYQGLGFARVAERKGYYQGGDALVLKSALPLSPERNIA